MWHGGSVELLQTIVSEGEDNGAAMQGGVSLAFSCGNDGEAWRPSNWTLRDIRGNPQDSIQIELISSDTVDLVEIRYIVILEETTLSSELMGSNFKSKLLQLTGSVISHLTANSKEAIYAAGFEGSDFFNMPPVSSNFVIIPSDISQENNFSIGQLLWSRMGFLSGSGAGNEAESNGYTENEKEMQGDENDNYKQLAEKMSRIYTSAPTQINNHRPGQEKLSHSRTKRIQRAVHFQPRFKT